MMSRIKKWLSEKSAKAKLAAGIMAVLFLTAGAAAAYLIYQAVTVNRIRVGSNTISVTEDFEPPKEQDVDNDNIFKKQIQIENVDSTAAFVRVFMDFSDSSIKELAKISPDAENYYSADEYTSSDFQYLPEHWVYISEEDDEALGGYYYYTLPVNAKESTTPLVESILVNYGGEGSSVKDFDILVVADSIQTWINEKTGDNSFVAKDVSEDLDGWKQAWSQYLERR